VQSGVETAPATPRGCARALLAGDYAEAHRCYDKSLQLDPGNADAHVARGAALANQQQLAEALHSFEAALGINGDHANAAKYRDTVQQRMQQEAADRGQHQHQHHRQGWDALRPDASADRARSSRSRSRSRSRDRHRHAAASQHRSQGQGREQQQPHAQPDGAGAADSQQHRAAAQQAQVAAAKRGEHSSSGASSSSSGGSQSAGECFEGCCARQACLPSTAAARATQQPAAPALDHSGRTSCRLRALPWTSGGSGGVGLAAGGDSPRTAKAARPAASMDVSEALEILQRSHGKKGKRHKGSRTKAKRKAKQKHKKGKRKKKK
jgi:tetratricopeptide (TPR) repeat protein